MRSYGNSKQFLYKKTATYKQRHDRLDTQWDVRIDVNELLTVEDIIMKINDDLNKIQYILIGDTEEPDTRPDQDHATNKEFGSNGNHVHIALVLYIPHKRADVLQLLRGRRKITDEYCAPRNRIFTYAGWVLHHTKPRGKINPNGNGIRYEYGECPIDAYTTDEALKIEKMVQRFGRPEITKRYVYWLNMLTQNKIKEKIEQLQMSMNDYDIDE